MTALTLTALLLLSQTPSDALRDETETKARADLATLLSDVCSGKCFVLNVVAKVDERDEKPAEPGFEQVTAPKKIAVLRSLTASVLADEKLPESFRGRLRTLVTQRLKGYTPNVTVSVETLALPSEEPKEVAAPVAVTPPAAVVTPPPPAPEPELELKERILKKLVDDAAIVAVSVLLAVALIICATLLRRSRDDRPSTAQLLPSSPDSAPKASGSLRAVDPQLRRVVLRDAAAAAEWPLLASWLAALGPDAAADLRGQLDADGQVALDSALSTAGALDPQAVAAFERRVASASLRQLEDPVEQAFAFIGDSDPQLFAECSRRLSKSALHLALRFAPARHRRAVLEGLTDTEKADAAQSWAAAHTVQLPVAKQAAAELAALLSNVGGLRATEAALADLLYAMPTAEQRKLITSLGSAANGLADRSEVVLDRAAPDVLAAAVATMPAAKVASYLAGAEAATKSRVLAACSPTLKAELERALSGATADQFFAARAEVVDRVRRAMKQKRGGAV